MVDATAKAGCCDIQLSNAELVAIQESLDYCIAELKKDLVTPMIGTAANSAEALEILIPLRENFYLVNDEGVIFVKD